MRRVLLISLFGAIISQVTCLPQPCSSNEIATTGARCCGACPPGSGVLSPCSATNNTQCQPCELQQTFSAATSHQEKCQPCSKCPENSRAVRPCNTTMDVVCECLQGRYLRAPPGRQGECAPCDLCPPGQGSGVECTPVQNTRCRRCVGGSWSAVRGLGPCRSCIVCGEEQLLLQRCRPTEDTICMDITPVKPTFLPFFPKTVSAMTQNVTEAGKSDVLPVYCAFLAGLVAGLVAYVIVLQVRRNRARHIKTLSPLSHGTSIVRDGVRLAPPAGGSTGQLPKHGSDSGVFVDIDNAKIAAASPSYRIRDLPSSFRRALEISIHTAPDNRGGWRTLARQLGYNSTRSSAFTTRANRDKALPAHYLLSDWSKKSHATVGALQVALYKIGRDDVSSLFHTDNLPFAPPPDHRRSRESVSAPLGRSHLQNPEYRPKPIGIRIPERQPDGAEAQPETVSPQHRNHRRSLAMSLTGSQRLINV